MPATVPDEVVAAAWQMFETAPTRVDVPFVDLGATHRLVREEIDTAIAGVLDRSDFVLGDAVRQFEEAFAGYCGVRHAIGVDSGFSALELTMRAYGIGEGDEVITAANTFVATVGAIDIVGARPVLVDVIPETLTLDPEQVEASITPATRAIVPVHLYGQPADMDATMRIAATHGLLVIEDACQAHGARYRGARAGSLGTTTKYVHELKGYNRRLDTLHAAVLAVKLARLDAANASRRRTAALYDELLADSPVTTPTAGNDMEHVYHLYVIQTEDRDALRTHLEEAGVATGVHYPVPVHRQPAYRELGYKHGDFPVTERSAARILSLPMYPGMPLPSIVHTARSVCSYFTR
jgi:dTDP-4-amino-4,6-dideoxygalactose transaminase